MFGALSYAELGAAIPEAGGEYAYLRRGFGPVWGFLFGWMHSIVGRPASVASIAAGLAALLGIFHAGSRRAALHIPLSFAVSSRRTQAQFVFTWAQPLAVVALVVMTFINYLGVRLGGQVQVALTFSEDCGGAGDYCDWDSRWRMAAQQIFIRFGRSTARVGHLDRISGGAGGVVVGLRRMGGPQSGWLRGAAIRSAISRARWSGASRSSRSFSCCSAPFASTRCRLPPWRRLSMWRPMCLQASLDTARLCGSRSRW